MSGALPSSIINDGGRAIWEGSTVALLEADGDLGADLNRHVPVSHDSETFVHFDKKQAIRHEIRKGLAWGAMYCRGAADDA